MLKINSWSIILIAILFLSGCSLPNNKNSSTNSDTNKSGNASSAEKILTKIVSQTEGSIGSFREFISEAQNLSIKNLGANAKLKLINFNYFDKDFTYVAYFVDLDKNTNTSTSLYVFYNKSCDLVDHEYVHWYKTHKCVDNINRQITAIKCSSENCITDILSLYGSEDLDIKNLNFSVSDFRNNYPVEKEWGRVEKIKGVLAGYWGTYKFKPSTGELDVNNLYNEMGDTWYMSSSSPIYLAELASSTLERVVYRNANYTDEDGLSDLQENILGTNPKNKDSDDDGHSDSEEINSGYNPLGSGKFISEECAKNPSDEKCYIQFAIANKDISFCQKISSSEDKVACVFKVDIMKKEKNVCGFFNIEPYDTNTNLYSKCLTSALLYTLASWNN